MAPYVERLHERRDELFRAHPPPRGKAGDWSHMLLLVALDVGAGEPMTEDWLLATSRLRSRKTFRDALAFFVEHGLVVAERLPGASWGGSDL